MVEFNVHNFELKRIIKFEGGVFNIKKVNEEIVIVQLQDQIELVNVKKMKQISKFKIKNLVDLSIEN